MPPFHLIRPGHPDDLVERFGGYFVSAAIGLVAFTSLAVYRFPIQRIVDETAREMKIILSPAPAPIPVPPLEALPAEATFTEIVATSVNAAENAAAVVAVRAQELAANPGEEIRPRPAADLASWTPTSPDEERRVAELRQSVLDFKDQLDKEQNSLKAELNRLSVESAGRQFLLNSDGGRSGMIRTLDIADFPQHVVYPVLNRYGISIEYKHVDPNADRGRGFLNAATTSEGTFTTVAREGFYEVFVLSAKAVAMLSTKELIALQKRGYDPNHSRIRRVKFGIVKNEEDRFDLDVTEMEVERVR